MSVLSTTAVLPPPARPPLARLAKIEVRKFVDTRSGSWLLVIAALLSVMAAGTITFVDGGAEKTSTIFTVATYPLSILLPVIGILGITSEFSQRTALQTFTWVPQRGRVMVAKAIAFAVFAVAGFCLALLSGLVFGLVSGAEMDLTFSSVVQVLLVLVLYVFTGFGFGMLFGTPALAIVTWFVLPNVIGMLTNFISALEPASDWTLQGVAWLPLVEGRVRADDWPQIASAAAIWIAIPVVLGWLRLRRREVS